MKNKLLRLILIALSILLSCLSISSCQSKPSWSTYFEALSDSQSGSLDLVEKAKDIENVPLDKLTVYPYASDETKGTMWENKFFPGKGRYWYDPSTVGGEYNIDEYNQCYPIEYINVLDDHLILVVSKLQREDGGQVYAYSLMNLKEVEDTTDSTSRKDKIWVSSREYYFLSKPLAKADYDHIQIGDNFSKVCEIDPAAAWDLQLCYFKLDVSSDYHKRSVFYSMRLLTDGVMVISMKTNVNWLDTSKPESKLPSSYDVIDIEFYPYGSTPPKVPTESIEGVEFVKYTLNVLPYGDKLEFPTAK